MPDQPSDQRVRLAGSEQIRPQGIDRGPVDADQRAEVTVVLRSSRTSDQHFDQILEAASAQPMNSRRYLSREQLSAVRAANASDIEQIKNFADAHHLTVKRLDDSARTVSLEGTLKDLEQAFGVELRNYEADGRTFRAANGAVQLPREIASAVTAVLGLDTRPVAHPH